MTHYNVDYSNLTPQAKHEKAIVDIEEYLGDECYTEMSKVVTELQPSFEQFQLWASMAGVQGYPVWAWHAELIPFG